MITAEIDNTFEMTAMQQGLFPHEQPVDADALRPQLDGVIVAGGEPHSEEVDAVAREDEDEHEEEDGDQEDLLEAAAKLAHHLSTYCIIDFTSRHVFSDRLPAGYHNRTGASYSYLMDLGSI